jgi:hypothetical protein
MKSTGRRSRVLAAAGLAVALASQATAAETLTDAWALALEKDRGFAAIRSQAEAADLDAAAARAQRWPTLAVGGDYTWLDDAPAFDFSFTGLPVMAPELVGGDDFARGAATLSVPLFTSGRISSSIAAAEATGRSAGARRKAPTGPQARGRGVLRWCAAHAQGAFRGGQQRHDTRVAGPTSARCSSVSWCPERPARGAGRAGRRAAEPPQGRERRGDRARVLQPAARRADGAPSGARGVLPEPAGLPADLDGLLKEALDRRTELDALDEQAEA